VERRDGDGVAMAARTLARPGILLMIAAAVVTAACNYGNGTSPTSTDTTAPTAPTAPTVPTTPPDPGTPTTPAPAGLTYTKDIQPIMSADCVRCHGPSRRDAGYGMSSYAGVMRAVTAGSASSMLVRVTQSNGIMYSQLSGSRATKATTIRDWVVTWKAQQ